MNFLQFFPMEQKDKKLQELVSSTLFSVQKQDFEVHSIVGHAANRQKQQKTRSFNTNLIPIVDQ